MGGFYGFVVPALPTRLSIIAGVVYGVLASSTVIAGVMACLKDPIDPNVRRFHQVRAMYIVYSRYIFFRLLGSWTAESWLLQLCAYLCRIM